MRGDFDGSDQRFKDAADRHGKGKVDRRNLAEMYHKAVKKLNVRENITCRKHVANMSQTCRNDVAHRTPRAPPPAGQAIRLRPPTDGRQG